MDIKACLIGLIIGLITMSVIQGIVGAKCARAEENRRRCFFAAAKYDFQELSWYLDFPTFERKMIMVYCVVGITVVTTLMIMAIINIIASIMFTV